MPRLPQVSGEELIKLFKRLGYEQVSQRGSHVKMRKLIAGHRHNITIPFHKGKTIPRGTLADILKDIGEKNNFSRDELLAMLKD